MNTARRFRHACLFLIAFGAPVTALRAQATGTLQGSVRSAQADIPLPYAVVSIPALALERFTDPQGRFVLPSLRTGTYDITIRRIGYSPFRGQVRIDSGSTAQLAVTLQQIPVTLATTKVRAMAFCPHPGVPDERTDPEVFTLVSLLRENAERYRLLSSQYPFIYLQIRALGELGPRDLFVSRVDTLLVRSATPTAYAPGRVVARTPDGRGGREYTMVIPTLVDVADDRFTRNHCFGYGGVVREGNETWVRLDVRAADRLRTPDVNGSFFLDSATAQLRRMTLSLSRPERLPRQLRGILGVDMVTSFTDIADGISVIDKVCAVNRIVQPKGRLVPVAPAELQQLLLYEFTEAPPDLRKRGAWLPPNAWRATARLERSAVWCAGDATGP